MGDEPKKEELETENPADGLAVECRLENHEIRAIAKAFDVAIRHADESATVFGSILLQIEQKLGIRK
jgi:hypothetical protein